VDEPSPISRPRRPPFAPWGIICVLVGIGMGMGCGYAHAHYRQAVTLSSFRGVARYFGFELLPQFIQLPLYLFFPTCVMGAIAGVVLVRCSPREWLRLAALFTFGYAVGPFFNPPILSSFAHIAPSFPPQAHARAFATIALSVLFPLISFALLFRRRARPGTLCKECGYRFAVPTAGERCPACGAARSIVPARCTTTGR
jgi:hypothetical protein